MEAWFSSSVGWGNKTVCILVTIRCFGRDEMHFATRKVPMNIRGLLCRYLALRMYCTPSHAGTPCTGPWCAHVQTGRSERCSRSRTHRTCSSTEPGVVGAGTASEREGYRAKSSRDQEAKASGSGRGGRMAQTQRAANVKGRAGARASVSAHNLRCGGEG